MKTLAKETNVLPDVNGIIQTYLIAGVVPSQSDEDTSSLFIFSIDAYDYYELLDQVETGLDEDFVLKKTLRVPKEANLSDEKLLRTLKFQLNLIDVSGETVYWHANDIIQRRFYDLVSYTDDVVFLKDGKHTHTVDINDVFLVE